jgi:hypothetical protein
VSGIAGSVMVCSIPPPARPIYLSRGKNQAQLADSDEEKSDCKFAELVAVIRSRS